MKEKGAGFNYETFIGRCAMLRAKRKSLAGGKIHERGVWRLGRQFGQVLGRMLGKSM
jgi:hypothetical protein